jgi:hypothetical protein
LYLLTSGMGIFVGDFVVSGGLLRSSASRAILQNVYRKSLYSSLTFFSSSSCRLLSVCSGPSAFWLHYYTLLPYIFDHI